MYAEVPNRFGWFPEVGGVEGCTSYPSQPMVLSLAFGRTVVQVGQIRGIFEKSELLKSKAISSFRNICHSSDDNQCPWNDGHHYALNHCPSSANDYEPHSLLTNNNRDAT